MGKLSNFDLACNISELDSGASVEDVISAEELLETLIEVLHIRNVKEYDAVGYDFVRTKDGERIVGADGEYITI